MITNISKSKDLIGPSPGKSERGILKEKNQNDQDFCWACNFNPRIFSTWMTSQMYSFQICRVFPTYEDFKVIRKGFAICNLSCINLRVFCLIALLSHTAYNFLFWTMCNINIWQRMSLSSMIYRASCQIILTKTKTYKDCVFILALLSWKFCSFAKGDKIAINLINPCLMFEWGWDVLPQSIFKPWWKIRGRYYNKQSTTCGVGDVQSDDHLLEFYLFSVVATLFSLNGLFYYFLM